MTYKVFVNYILVRLKIRQILPSHYVSKVKVIDNKEPLVQINLNPDIVFDSRMQPPIYLRQSVYEKLLTLISAVEKDGFQIKLYDAYRSLDEQKRSWNLRFEQTKLENPNLPASEITRITSLKVANPENIQNVGGHQTGGAIDITLLKDGKELDMGTKYEEYNNKTKTNAHNLNTTQNFNRKYLRKNLEHLGFCNFPAEWWHYSFGDKMWAAYKYKKSCIYGYISSPSDSKKINS